MDWSLRSLTRRYLYWVSLATIAHLSPLWKPTSLKRKGAGPGNAENTSGWSSADIPLALLSPRRLNRLSKVATHAGLWGEGWGREQGHAFTPSRRSCTQVGTGRLRGLPPLSATARQGPRRASEGLGSPRVPLPAPRSPGDGKRTRLDQPTRKPSPSSHLPARDARSRARPLVPARPFGAPLPRERMSPASLLAPGSNPPDARPAGRAPNAATPADPARAHAPPGPLPAARAHSRGHAHAAPQLDRPTPRRALPRASSPTRPASSDWAVSGGGEGRRWPSVLTYH